MKRSPWIARFATAALAIASPAIAHAIDTLRPESLHPSEPCTLPWTAVNSGLTDLDVLVVAVDPIVRRRCTRAAPAEYSRASTAARNVEHDRVGYGKPERCRHRLPIQGLDPAQALRRGESGSPLGVDSRNTTPLCRDHAFRPRLTTAGIASRTSPVKSTTAEKSGLTPSVPPS